MIVIVQPWFSAVGHPAQSIINLAKIVGNNDIFIYLISIVQNSLPIEEARQNIEKLGSVIDYKVKTESIREGTVKALITLSRMFSKNASIDRVFFLDAHLVLLAFLWQYYANKNIKFLGVVYLMGPERVTRYKLIKLLIARFLKRKEVVLFLRTNELVLDWKVSFPNARIKCLPSLEIPCDEQSYEQSLPSSNFLRLGIFGQIRKGKSLEWLIPIFKNNPKIGKLTVAGAFCQPADVNLQNLLKEFDGFKEGYLQEQELLRALSEQDYLLMLYDNWDSRMEGAVMFLAARVNKPVIVYDRGWCGRMVKTYKNGLLAPLKHEDFIEFIESLPLCDSDAYQDLLKGVTTFRKSHSGQVVLKALLKEFAIE